MVDPQRVHWTAAKHILRYIRGTVEYGLVYEHRGSVQLAGFIDADWVGCVEDQKSTSGCCFNIGSRFVSLLRREIPMSWGTTTDNLTPEINIFQYAIENKCLTLKDQTSYLIPNG